MRHLKHIDIELKLLDETFEILDINARFSENIFSSLGVERLEVFTHSKIIYSILSMKNYPVFMNLFLKELDIDEPLINAKWKIGREWAFENGRIDLLLFSSDLYIAIEMKIDAGDQPLQLKRYEEYIKLKSNKYKVYYLTLLGTSPSSQSICGMETYPNLISFSKHIINWLKTCIYSVKTEDPVKSYLEQYLYLIQKIASEDYMKNEIINLIDTPQKMKSVIELAKAADSVKNNTMIEFFKQIAYKCDTNGHPFDVNLIPELHKNFSSETTILIYNLLPLDHDNKIRLTLSIKIHEKLFWGLGFTKYDTKNKCNSIQISKILAESKYNDLINLCETLFEHKLRTENNELHWNHFSNMSDEKFNFKSFSDSCIDLLDNSAMDIESEHLAQQIITLKQKLIDNFDVIKKGDHYT